MKKVAGFEALEAFSIVAAERSFTKAAARLQVTQSALSQTIRGLEDRLGVRLLARTTRSVAPTAAGAKLLDSLQPAFSQIENGLQALSTLKNSPTGLIRINCSEHAAHYVVWPRLVGFLTTHRDIQLDLHVENRLVDIVSGQYDAGVRSGDLIAKDMIAVPLGPPLRMLVVGTPSYFKRHSLPARPEQLADHPCINVRMPTLGNVYAWEFEKRSRKFSVKVEGSVLANSPYILLQAVLAGLGLGYLPEDVVREPLSRGKLVQVLDDWCQPYPGYHLYYPSRRQHTPAFSALIRYLRE